MSKFVIDTNGWRKRSNVAMAAAGMDILENSTLR